MPTSAISADWAAQRIKGLSLVAAVLNALLGRAGLAQGRGDQDPDRRVPVSATRSRPDVGGCARPDPCAGRRGASRPQSRADRARRVSRQRRSSPQMRRAGRPRYLGSHFLSTMPVRDLIRAMDPPGTRGGPAGRRGPQVSRLPHGRPDRGSARNLPRYMDLYPRTRCPGRSRSRTSRTGRQSLVPDASRVEPGPGVLLL